MNNICKVIKYEKVENNALRYALFKVFLILSLL